MNLAGQGSDPDGDALTYTWSQISGPDLSFSATDTADVTATMPTVAIGEQQDLVLRLTVTDNKGASASDDVTISVSSSDFLVFLADKDEDEKTELYKYDPETDSVSKLSETLVAGGDVLQFSISPDGLSVAYAADQDVESQIELYVAASDGSGIVKVSAPMDNVDGDVDRFDYQWSPDSSQLVYTADADVDNVSEVYLVDRDGANHQKINGNTAGMVELERVQWSPDGRYIAQQVRDLSTGRRLGINVYDTTVGSSNSTRITNIPAFGALSLFEVNDVESSYFWSPDSTRVAYIADQSEDEVFELYTAFADGSANPKVSDALVSDGDVLEMEWSPDGSRIVYLADQDSPTDFELYLVMADGSGALKLNAPLPSGGDVFQFRWAPDGSRVQYRADQDTDNVIETYTIRPDGTDRAKINGPLVTGGGTDASFSSFLEWAPDSQWIAYTADQETDGVREVYVSAADGSSNTKVSGPMVGGGVLVHIGSGRYGWAPDSSRFSYIGYQLRDDYDIFVSDINGTTNPQINRMPVPGGSITWFAQWSADGSRLVYSAEQDSAEINELFMATPDGLSNVNISGAMVSGGDVIDQEYMWSPVL